MNKALFSIRQFVSLTRNASHSTACCQVVTSPEEIARLYRDLSLFPSLSRADVGPAITSQYGGKYSNIYTGRSLVDFMLARWHISILIHIGCILFTYSCRMEPAWSGKKWECQILQTVHCIPRWQVGGLLWSLGKLHRDQRRVCQHLDIPSGVSTPEQIKQQCIICVFLLSGRLVRIPPQEIWKLLSETAQSKERTNSFWRCVCLF